MRPSRSVLWLRRRNCQRSRSNLTTCSDHPSHQLRECIDVALGHLPHDGSLVIVEAARHETIPGVSFYAVGIGDFHPPFVAELAFVTRERFSLTGKRDHVFEKVHAAEADIIFPVVESDRKSTRLNSSHVKISYAVFC